MEMTGFTVTRKGQTRTFDVKMDSTTDNIVVDFDLPAGLPQRLTEACGENWFDVAGGNSVKGVHNGMTYTVKRA
eukprot:m.292942 g.292942  ORF g.292942 m.292942 type:complete len:74 (-) comp17831_c1_seq1:94-315(-)